MEKGFREFLRIWWRQPFDFAWTARHLRARGMLRIHQVFIGVFSLLYGLTALLTVVWASRDGGAVTGQPLVMVVAISSAVLGVIWIVGPFPSERQSVAFAVYADLAVLTVIACYQDAFVAMPGLALLAANGIYIVVAHGPRALALHLAFTVAAFGWLYGLALAQDTAEPAVVTVRVLVLLPTVVGVPVIVQSYLLALRMGAVDALYDPLTRLLNRRGLDEEITGLVPAGGAQIGVLAVDIDKFKAINDAHGHDTGDRVLVSVANAARDAVTSLRVRSVIARTGGEEFVLVVDAGPRTVLQVAGQLHEAVARCDGATVPTISVGVATAWTAGDELPRAVRALLERADAAMYRAKSAGGNRTVSADDGVSAAEGSGVPG
ncbi:GGDEF domain-containing protein [Mycolicibacterium rufum]|uniref:GGDEF domain-containing protein n=1 Tax=Mycolicibacterium rufum TaxID=318424 RepID=A0A9X2YGQ2_9MYCO|nr:GGDEF domain-containing protein [Mycolicibacterium rufum]KGI66552.1 diguanylate cyclase [Mycolicibacterium rufum]MCV7072898.1 GGDEF domain-containing protein [Mycolicibacterium rufum]ULP37318.1 GGDEF domain-containing protein [Mycolicibacterium rufum]